MDLSVVHLCWPVKSSKFRRSEVNCKVSSR
uniref:Uncharacterized protein n=1 Tax=Rhizophora mucronata TaxID=61149 RepID=A0A2P2QMA0_RHIMU